MNNVMLAISGKKNSGKTTLIEKLIPLLQDRGISLCVIKHDGHSFDADVKGKDTYRFFQAGARGTAIFDNEKFMVVKHEAVDEAFLSSFFTDVDLVLMEGFKWTDWPKFEIVREGNSDHHFCDEKHLLGIISDFGYNIEGIPTYNLNNYEEIANVIENYVNEEKRQEEDEHNLEAVPLEKELVLLVNGTVCLEIICSGTELEEQILGTLFCRGLIKSRDDILSMELKEREDVIMAKVITRGIAVEYELPDRQKSIPPEKNNAIELCDAALDMSNKQKATKGLHWCALCADNKILYYADDLGRHNAIDKAVGKYIEGNSNNVDTLITSGRVSYEMVCKARKLNAIVICSLSTVTERALKEAKRSGITIIGYAKKEPKVFTCVDDVSPI